MTADQDNLGSSIEEHRVQTDRSIDSSIYSTVSSLLWPIRNQLFKTRCEYYRLKNRYACEWVHDCGIQLINPNRIQHITSYTTQLDYSHQYLDIGAFDRFKRTGCVLDGDWDVSDVSFSELYVYRGMIERFKHGVPWSETKYFTVFAEAIKRGESAWGCSSLEELYDRCQYIESLYNRIKSDGYRSQRELNKYPVDEVNVNIGRDGELLFNDGRHRLAIAKVLNIKEIPVRILVLHKEYYSSRDHLF